MKGLENKTSLSENHNTKSADPCFYTLHTSMDYLLIGKSEKIRLEIPCNGYLNILPYQMQADLWYLVDEETFNVEKSQNILQQVQKGQKLYIPEIHHDSRYVVVFIAQHTVVDMSLKINQKPLVTTESSRITLLKKRVVELQASSFLSKNIRIQSLLLDLLAFQLELIASKTDIPLHNNLLEKVTQAQILIEHDLTKSYTISELAKAVGTNEQYLKIYFKRHLGKTIMNYILEVKMLYAKKLILTGDCRIADVAQMTGYKHATHFSMSFKKYFGVLPTALRSSICLLSFNNIEVLNAIHNLPIG